MTDLHAPMTAAATTLRGVLRNVRSQQLADPTPCAEYDVRGLCNHLLYWGPRLEAAARNQDPPESTGSERDADLVVDDWVQRLEHQVAGLVDAFAPASAWQGTTRMAGADMPAAMIGSMVLCEFVLHGWDLATATGARFDCEPATAEAIEHVMNTMGEQGRAMGAFGPAVAVAETAPALDRALGLAGRDPKWRA